MLDRIGREGGAEGLEIVFGIGGGVTIETYASLCFPGGRTWTSD